MLNEYKAAGLEPAALCNPFSTYNFKRNKIKKPDYYSDFVRCENTDVILITTEWNILNWLRRCLNSRVCLLCEDDTQQYDFSFCWDKNVCVLHSSQSLKASIKLINNIKRHDPIKIDVVKIDINNSEEIIYANH